MLTVFEAQDRLNHELSEHGLMVDCESHRLPVFDLYRRNDVGAYAPFWIPWTENDWMGEGRRHASFSIAVTSHEIIDFVAKYVRS